MITLQINFPDDKDTIEIGKEKNAYFAHVPIPRVGDLMRFTDRKIKIYEVAEVRWDMDISLLEYHTVIVRLEYKGRATKP